MLVVGLLLMLLPSGSAAPESGGTDDKIAHVLSCTQGVGEARVIVSEHGVVVVCGGADNALTRLQVTEAVSAYTGFGADRIRVLKMQD